MSGAFNPPNIVSRNLPQRWQAGWKRFRIDDPFLAKSYSGILLIDWSDVMTAAWLSSLQRQSIDFVNQMGLRDGVTVPLHLPSGGFVFMSAMTRERPAHWRHRKSAVEHRLLLLEHLFIDRYRWRSRGERLFAWLH